jgi:hypothetical protein
MRNLTKFIRPKNEQTLLFSCAQIDDVKRCRSSLFNSRFHSESDRATIANGTESVGEIHLDVVQSILKAVEVISHGIPLPFHTLAHMVVNSLKSLAR